MQFPNEIQMCTNTLACYTGWYYNSWELAPLCAKPNQTKRKEKWNEANREEKDMESAQIFEWSGFELVHTSSHLQKHIRICICRVFECKVCMGTFIHNLLGINYAPINYLSRRYSRTWCTYCIVFLSFFRPVLQSTLSHKFIRNRSGNNSVAKTTTPTTIVRAETITLWYVHNTNGEKM